jgi:hypothetical protein
MIPMKRGRFLDSLFAKTARTTPGSRSPSRPLRVRHIRPLLAFVVPNVIVGYGLVIPRSCIAGVNELTVGFAASIAGACITYMVGVRSALRDGAN